jgi:hypothetical protein
MVGLVIPRQIVMCVMQRNSGLQVLSILAEGAGQGNEGKSAIET